MKDEIKEILSNDNIHIIECEKNWCNAYGYEKSQMKRDAIKYITILEEENQRLNNIIDELEKWLEYEANFWKQQQEEAIKNGWLEFGGKYNTTIIYEDAIDKLKELKEALNGGDEE